MNPAACKNAFLVSRIPSFCTLIAHSEITCRWDHLKRLTRPEVSTMASWRSGSCLPFATNRALTLFRPSAISHVRTHLVCSICSDALQGRPGSKTPNFSHAPSPLIFAARTNSACYSSSSGDSFWASTLLCSSATHADAAPSTPSITGEPCASTWGVISGFHD